MGFASFTAVEPPIRIDASITIGAKGRLLVLLDSRDHDCPSHGDGKDRDKDDGKHDDGKHKDGGYGAKTYSGGGNGHDHDHDDKHCHKDHDPHGPAGAPTLSAQRSFLESLLTEAGWSYTITDTADAFTHELRSGAYNAYLLLSEQEKLSEQAQKELREAVFRGEGLVLAGSHDNRNHRLNDALGIKRIGTVAHADAVSLPDGSLGESGSITLIPGDRINRIKRLSAESLATYELGGSSRSGEHDCRDEDDDHDDGHKDHGDHKDGDDKHRKTYGKDDDPCHGQPDAFVDAITLNTYGRGKALFAGFDLLAQGTKDGADSRAVQTLLAGLNITHPIPKAALGVVVPVKLTLVNQGIATAATAQVFIPSGVQVIDAGSGQVENTQTGQTVTWSVNLGLGEERALIFYIRLPGSEATLSLQAMVTAIVGNVTRVINEASLDLTVEPIASLDELLAQANALSSSLPAHRQALRDAAEDLEHAIRANRLDRAIDYAIKATDALLGITEPQVVELRRGIGEWLRYTLMLAN